MLSGITVFCFAASYTVAFVLEATRLLFRSTVRGAVMIGFAGAGLLAHTLFLVYRATNAGGTPLSSEFDWFLIAAWLLAAAYLYLTIYHPRTPIGLLVLPLVLLLIAVAKWWADEAPVAAGRAVRVWLTIHLGFLLLGTVTVLMGFVAGVVYLWQAWRLKHKLPPPQRFQLPTLEWLERMNGRMLVISALMLSIGFVSGMILNLVNPHRVPWTDPVIVFSGLLLAWVVAAALFNALYKPARSGRKVAYLTVATFVFLMASVAGLLVSREHGSKVEAPPQSSQSSLAGGEA